MTRSAGNNGPMQYAMCVPCVAGSNRDDPRFPLHSFRRTDYELPPELCQASHSREESARNDPICNMCALRYARTRGVSACHVSSSPSHSSGALIGNRRASYARQATRENGVRQVAPVYDSFRVKVNGPQPVTVTVACRASRPRGPALSSRPPST